MLAHPRHSCVVLVNAARGAAANASEAFAGSLPLLSICQEFFAIPQIAIGGYERALLPNQVAASIEHIDVDALSMWRDPQLAERLARSDVGVIFLGGAFLEEEVLISALEGARRGYDVRLLSDLSIARHESDRALVLARLAHHGILATTIRQALLEWAMSLEDFNVSQKIQELLS
ncbi:isochorismatase family protein [Bradyrhizobium tropiciagri]|uniref:isochorismatase family protein n=1 Tax=Bradyrhizobium tropiciagri TaxID=312253 RepID=UPI001BA997B8|nr:isochorismatase family protein [Bradyrhizobium tropiciagri]MBR0900099.1 isochorismatase family protein [Bradyrhizobium tropiciagri]